MSAVSVSSQANEAAFEQFLDKYGTELYKLAEWIARRTPYHCLIQADDIYSEAIKKLWRSYYRPGVASTYQYRGESQHRKLMGKIVESAHIDLYRRWEDELNMTESLDAPLKSNPSATLGDVIRSDTLVDDPVGEEVVAGMIISGAMERQVSQSRSELTEPVAEWLLSGICSEKLKDYTPNHIAVTESRLRNKVRKDLNSGS
jgi:DNA-directed RNA polymerase specialized sigma24 family protein